MAQSFVLTSTSDPMVALKVLVLLPSSLQKMLATPSSSLMATIGRAVYWRSARIALLALGLVSVAVEALAVVEASEEASGHVVALAAAVALVEDMAAREVVMMLALQLLLLIPLQTMPRLEPREVRLFMSATQVLLYSVRGLPLTYLTAAVVNQQRGPCGAIHHHWQG